jgi:hypothetical protein
VFESLKSEKVLTLDHWRYRLLHWTFIPGVEVKTPDDGIAAGISSSFYSHYCPLFHLTNLMVIFLPFIILFKVVVKLVKLTCELLYRAQETWRFISNLLAKKEKTEAEEWNSLKGRVTRSEKLKEKKLFIKWLKDPDYVLIDINDFNEVWRRIYGTGNFPFSEKEELEGVWTKYREAIITQREQRKARQAEMRRRMVFWVNFSHNFIKAALNIFYVVLAVFFLFGSYYVGGMLLSAIISIWSFLWNVDILASLATMLVYLLKFILFTCIFFLLILPAWRPVKKVALIVYDVIDNFIQWLQNTFVNIIEFFGMFYEQNCPPIKIVEDEVDAAVEEL